MVTVLGKDSGNSLQKEFPNGDCYLGLQNLTKSRGGVQKSIFLQKKWIFRWSVTEIHQHGPTTFGVGRKKFAKIHFFTEKSKFSLLFTEIHQHGPTKFGVGRKNSQKSIFLQKKFRLYSTCYRNSSDGQNAPKKATVTTILIKAVTCSFLPSNSIV